MSTARTCIKVVTPKHCKATAVADNKHNTDEDHKSSFMLLHEKAAQTAFVITAVPKA